MLWNMASLLLCLLHPPSPEAHSIPSAWNSSGANSMGLPRGRYDTVVISLFIQAGLIHLHPKGHTLAH